MPFVVFFLPLFPLGACYSGHSLSINLTYSGRPDNSWLQASVSRMRQEALFICSKPTLNSSMHRQKADRKPAPHKTGSLHKLVSAQTHITSIKLSAALSGSMYQGLGENSYIWMLIYLFSLSLLCDMGEKDVPCNVSVYCCRLTLY